MEYKLLKRLFFDMFVICKAHIFILVSISIPLFVNKIPYFEYIVLLAMIIHLQWILFYVSRQPYRTSLYSSEIDFKNKIVYVDYLMFFEYLKIKRLLKKEGYSVVTHCVSEEEWDKSKERICTLKKDINPLVTISNPKLIKFFKKIKDFRIIEKNKLSSML